MYRPQRDLPQNRSKIHGICSLLSWPKDSYSDINRPPIRPTVNTISINVSGHHLQGRAVSVSKIAQNLFVL